MEAPMKPVLAGPEVSGRRVDPESDGVGPIRLALVGAGQRGIHAYGSFALRHPGRARFVAVAEPDAARRGLFATAHGISKECAYADWRTLITRSDGIDAVVIASPDREHYEPAVAALEHGYPILVEKPISDQLSEVLDLLHRVRDPADVTVAHSQRYTPFFATIKTLIDEGRIGELVTIDHHENVAYFHFVHSYVRGNWRRTDQSSPFILAKASHDLDLIRWLADAPCTSVASVGRLSHFRPWNAPAGAPLRCLDGCPARDTCAFFAPDYYLNEPPGWTLRLAVTEDPAPNAIVDALRTGPYGRCVYHCDNDVTDHQSTVLGFANGVSATFTVAGLSADGTRTIKLMGGRGDIRGHMAKGEIEVRTFNANGRPSTELIRVSADGDHGGGDDRMMGSFVSRLVERRGNLPFRESETSLHVSIDSHTMAFAAEESRINGSTLDPRRYL